jgi:hypothetical protein
LVFLRSEGTRSQIRFVAVFCCSPAWPPSDLVLFSFAVERARLVPSWILVAALGFHQRFSRCRPRHGLDPCSILSPSGPLDFSWLLRSRVCFGFCLELNSFPQSTSSGSDLRSTSGVSHNRSGFLLLLVVCSRSAVVSLPASFARVSE